MNDIIFSPPKYMKNTLFKIAEVLDFNRIRLKSNWSFKDKEGDVVYLENFQPSDKWDEKTLRMFVNIVLKNPKMEAYVELINGREVNEDGDLVCDMKVNGRLIQSYFNL